MCGIFVAINKEISSTENFSILAHRGPDGFGIWKHSTYNITFGHRRLAILDLTDAGKQPMYYRGNVITLNGEIYNFLEIRYELKAKGYSFQTDTDTEVVLAAYEEWGENCVHKFNGMWSFAIWNEAKKHIFFSRDRFGKKPLFYYKAGNQFIFASEMKALFQFLPEVKPAANFNQITANIFGYESTENCLIEGIKRFPAGSNGILNLESNEFKILKYWDTKASLHAVPKKYDDQVEEFRDIFIDACKIRMRSDVPIGTALSGGVDSSAIICSLAHIKKLDGERLSSNWQNAFVASFPGTFLDETKYAKKVVDYLGIPAHYITIDAAKSLNGFYESLFNFEELYLTSPFPMLETYKAVRDNGVVVTIDGHGADEMFSGYGTDLLDAFKDAGLNFSQILNILEAYKGVISNDEGQNPIGKIDFRFYWNRMIQTEKGRKNLTKFYLNKFQGKGKKDNPENGELGYFNSTLYEMFDSTILPTLLRNYDRYAMANSVEIRMPFMDHRLVSYSFSLPWQSKIKNGYSKAIIRDALEPIMPKEVIRRKSKIGFNTPIVDWMQNEWKEFLMDTIESSEFKECSLINSKKVSQEVISVISNPKSTFLQGQQAWVGLSPFFWEKAVIKSNFWKK